MAFVFLIAAAAAFGGCGGGLDFGRSFFVIVGNPGAFFFIAIDVGGDGGLDFVFLIAAAGGGGGTANILC